MLCGNFLSEKSCRDKLVVSTSFLSWLLNVSPVLTSLKYTATFFVVLVRCGFADRSWEYYVFDFGLYVSEICHFLCLSLMRSFVVQIFSFSRTLCGLLSHLDVFIVVPFLISTGLAIVAEADMRCGDFFFRKKVVVTN